MAIFNKRAGAAIALLVSLLMAAVVLGGAGLQDGLKSISSANVITGAVSISYCTGQAACSNLDYSGCAYVSGCSWSDGGCAGGELKACNLFLSQSSCETQSGCAWEGNECRTFGTRFDCGLVAGESCAAQITASDSNCVWTSGCSGTPPDCSSYGWQGGCEIAGCSWATCEGSYFYGDSDKDGFGHRNNVTSLCSNVPPSGFVSNKNDCDDSNSAINPSAQEACDGKDNNCNGGADEGFDLDSDYYSTCGTITKWDAPENQNISEALIDCNDGNDNVHPDALELCDGVDNNCNGVTDTDSSVVFYLDSDKDFYGNALVNVTGCPAPENYVAELGDCNDNDRKVNPDKNEVSGNGKDDDCNPSTRDDVADTTAPTISSLRSYPYEDSASIYWSTSEDAISNITYGTDSTNLNLTAKETESEIYHSLQITGLNPNTTYYYQITTCDYSKNCFVTNIFNFKTTAAAGFAPPGGAELGDLGTPIQCIYFADSDGDGFGNPDDTIETCERKKGYVDNPDDCNDKEPAIPAKSEVPNNSIDDDCNPLTKDDGTSIEEIEITKVRAGQITKDSATITWKTDRDSTSFVNYGTTFKEYPSEKKDDTKTKEHSITLLGLKEATRYYYQAGSCDTANDYCVSLADPSYQFITTKCTDADKDGYFAEGEACGRMDCDDSDASVTGNTTYYRDADSDGFGDATLIINYCEKPNGYSKLSNDCSDNNRDIGPNATEVCDGIDNNCNGQADENTIVSYYADSDGDGFGNASNKVESCTLVANRVNNSLDCNDNNVEIKPSAAEVCDGADNNCNSQIDEGVQIISYVDFDKDGFGDASNKTIACSFVAENTNNSLDCNDKDNTINPNATEICNAIDDNCASGIDEPFDVDRDGYFNQTLCGNVTAYASKLDPADNNDNVHPGAAERCDGLDNNVNSAIDDIGGKIIASETKCACTGKTESQIADIKQTKERLNGEDDNCDSRLAPEEADADADGFATYQGDCDDFNKNVNPKAAESCTNKVDDNCNNKIDDVSEGCTAPKQNPAATVTNPAPRTSTQETPQATSINQQVLKGEQTSVAAAAAAKQAEQAALAASAALGEEKAGFSPSWLFLPIGLVPVVILLAYLFYVKPRGGFGNLIGKKKKEEFVEEEFPAEEAKPAGIDSYISDTLAQGYSAEEIKKALLDKGWTEDAIEDAFRKQGL